MLPRNPRFFVEMPPQTRRAQARAQLIQATLAQLRADDKVKTRAMRRKWLDCLQWCMDQLEVLESE